MILASALPRRRALLEEIGYTARVIPSDIDESCRCGESCEELAERLACAKAMQQVSSAREEEVIVAADTVVNIDGTPLGKPKNGDEAFATLRLLSGATHEVSTGVCLLVSGKNGNLLQRSFVETTKVTFYDLSDACIAGYVRTGECEDKKAGAYGIQGAGRLLVRKIDGDYYNVVGIPIARFVREFDLLMEAYGENLI